MLGTGPLLDRACLAQVGEEETEILCRRQRSSFSCDIPNNPAGESETSRSKSSQSKKPWERSTALPRNVPSHHPKRVSHRENHLRIFIRSDRETSRCFSFDLELPAPFARIITLPKSHKTKWNVREGLSGTAPVPREGALGTHLGASPACGSGNALKPSGGRSRESAGLCPEPFVPNAEQRACGRSCGCCCRCRRGRPEQEGRGRWALTGGGSAHGPRGLWCK